MSRYGATPGPDSGSEGNEPGGHELGWNFAFDAQDGGNPAVRIFRQGSRLRAVVAESLRAGSSRRLSAVHAQAHDLLRRGVSADATVEVLGHGLPRAADRVGSGFAFTIIDLDPGGEVNVAGRHAPPVLMTGSQGFVWLLPAPLPGAGAHGARLAPGGRLIASTGTFLGDLDPQMLSGLPRLAGSATASELLATFGGGRATGGFLVATRVPAGGARGAVDSDGAIPLTRETA